MSYSWSPERYGLNNPLEECSLLEVCQHEKRFEFYLKWAENGKVRYSQVNGWEIKEFRFETLEEATGCIAYIIRQFRKHYKCPEQSIQRMKDLPIIYNGQAEVGDPIHFTYDGKPCKWKEPWPKASGPKRGRVNDQDLGR